MKKSRPLPQTSRLALALMTQGNRAMRFFPSPFGRRCPGGADEGTVKAAKAGKVGMNLISRLIFPLLAAFAVPSPQPLSRRERGFLSIARLPCLMTGVLLTSGAIAKTPAPQLGTSPLAEVIAAMTLEEKVALVNGEGMFIPGMENLDLGEERRAPVVGQSNKKVPGAAGTTFPIPHLGIPSIALADGPAGLRIAPTREGQERTFYATAFPIETSLASTWDVDLVQKVGAAMGHEVKEYGVDVLLAPGQNIHRYPLGGRNFEYYSEDPLLSGKISAAMVRGVQSQGVGVSIKHFVANNHEWNRHTIDVKIDERALREIYLRGFEIAVKEADPWTIMSSYNKLNGTYTSESSWLLTEVLRNQWKYNGLVVTDWFGGRDPVAQMQAGNELLMPGTQSDQDTLLAAVRGGALDERVLDRNIGRILELILRGPTFQQYAHSDQPDLQANAAIARTAAAEGMVLLKNERTALPLNPKAKLALFGNSGYEPVSGGTGSGDVNKAYMISFSQGLDEAGFVIDAAVAKANGAHIEAARAAAPPPVMFMPRIMLPEYAPTAAVIDAAAKTNDVAIVTIGRDSGEMLDRSDADFNVSDTERRMLSAISRAFRAQGKPVVVVLNGSGGGINEPRARDRKPDTRWPMCSRARSTHRANCPIPLPCNCPIIRRRQISPARSCSDRTRMKSRILVRSRTVRRKTNTGMASGSATGILIPAMWTWPIHLDMDCRTPPSPTAG